MSGFPVKRIIEATVQPEDSEAEVEGQMGRLRGVAELPEDNDDDTEGHLAGVK